MTPPADTIAQPARLFWGGASLIGFRGTGLFDHCRRTVEGGNTPALGDFRYTQDVPGAPRFFDVRGVKVGDELCLTWGGVTVRHDTTARLLDRARTDGLTHLLDRSEALERLENLHHAIQWNLSRIISGGAFLATRR